MLYTAESKFSDKLPLLKSNEQCWPWLLWFTFQPIFIICASKGLRRHILCHQNSDCVSQRIYICYTYTVDSDAALWRSVQRLDMCTVLENILDFRKILINSVLLFVTLRWRTLRPEISCTVRVIHCWDQICTVFVSS